MTDQTIAVIIPSNRGGQYLEAAVDSVRNQTFPVDEIILVDDGAPAPGLAEAASRLGLRYVRQEPSGLAVARNAGAAAAGTAWLAYLDDDDVWHSERIEAQLNALCDTPDAVAVCSGGWYMDADGVMFGEGWGARAATSQQMISYEAVPPRITTLLIRRDAYLAAGGCRTSMEPAEDNDLIQRLLQQGEFAHVDRQLVGYRRHVGNVTQRGLRGRQANHRVLGSLLQEAGDDAELSRLLRRHRRTFRRYAAADNFGELLDAVRRHEVRYAVRIAWWGLRYAPTESIAAVVERAKQRSARQKAT